MIAPDTMAGVPARMAQSLSYINVFAECCTYDREVDIGFDLGLIPSMGREMAGDYDLLHFHSLSFYNMVRSQFPKKPTVVTIHGLPDDQLRPGVPEGVKLHVVHAHLLSQFPTATFLPNWILDPPFPPSFKVNDKPVLYVPFWYRNRADIICLTRALSDCCEIIGFVNPVVRPNHSLLEDMRNAEFVFDQLRGDVGLTAYEAMASGAIPIVAPNAVNKKALEEFYGDDWPLPFTDNIGHVISSIKTMMQLPPKALLKYRQELYLWWKGKQDPIKRAKQLMEIYNNA